MVKKVLIVIIFLIFSTCNIFLYNYLNNIDTQYTLLIEEGTNHLDIIQKLSFYSNRGYILLYKILQTKNREEKEKLGRERDMITESNTKFLDSLANIYPQTNSLLEELILSRKKYRQVSDELIGLANQGNGSLALDEFDKILEPLFYDYQTHINKYFRNTNKVILENSANFSSDVKKRAPMILFFGFSPVIIFIIFSIVGAILLGTLFFISRPALENPE